MNLSISVIFSVFQNSLTLAMIPMSSKLLNQDYIALFESPTDLYDAANHLGAVEYSFYTGMKWVLGDLKGGGIRAECIGLEKRSR